MSKETTLHFFSGKMAAGKSTLAKQLAKRDNSILVVEDEWLEKLYPTEIKTISDYIQYSSRLKVIIKKHLLSLLSNEVTVIMDFPANTTKQREWFRDILNESKVNHVLHFVNKSDTVCKKQLTQRSQNKPKGSAFTTDEEFDSITKYFQPPLNEEGFNIKTYE
jgi:predicted kinase